MKNYGGKDVKLLKQTKKNGPEIYMSDDLVKSNLFATLRIANHLWKHMKITASDSAPSTLCYSIISK